MNETLMPISRQTFLGNLASAQQLQLTQLPPWAQSGVTGGWPFPQFNENAAMLFDLGRVGFAQFVPIITEGLSEIYSAIKSWILGRGWSSAEDFADAIEEWASENWAGPVWGEG